MFLLTSKPVLFVANVAEDDLAKSDTLAGVLAVREYAETHLGTEAVVVSAAIESELAELPEAEAAEYLAGLGVAESGVGALIRAAYHLLGLRTYLTAGEKEVRAWTIHAGDTAPRPPASSTRTSRRASSRRRPFRTTISRPAARWPRPAKKGSCARRAATTSSPTAT